MVDKINAIAGRTITGDLNYSGSYKSIEQWDEERFIKYVDAIFNADPELTAFRWHQYTPYFNDGEPCEFGVYANEDAFAAFGGVPEDWPYESGEVEEESEVEILSISEMGGFRTKYTYNPNGTDYNSRYTYYEEPCRKSPAQEASREFARGIDHFEDVLRTHFGDHAQVTATRDGFNVEHYEHD